MAAAVPYQLTNCPKCGRDHEFSLIVELAAQVVTFSGPSTGTKSAMTWGVEFRCPMKESSFSRDVPVPVDAGTRVLSVASKPAGEAPAGPDSDWRDVELAEWIRTSSSTARDFCRTMITSVLAAIPVYFAILKFLGFETVHGGGWRFLVVVPPFLLLAALLAFVLTLRPVFQRIDRETLASARERRLATMNAWIIAGLTMFGIAVLGAVVVFLILVWQ